MDEKALQQIDVAESTSSHSCGNQLIEETTKRMLELGFCVGCSSENSETGTWSFAIQVVNREVFG